MKGISRIDSYRCKGWYVRIYRDGQIYAKLFSDHKYGGRQEALKCAKDYKQALELESPPPEKLPFRTKLLRNNKTGVNGVSETYHRTPDGDKLQCFSVHYRLDGRIYHKRFYHHHYINREEALKEAAQFRREMEAVILREWKQRGGK